MYLAALVEHAFLKVAPRRKCVRPCFSLDFSEMLFLVNKYSPEIWEGGHEYNCLY